MRGRGSCCLCGLTHDVWMWFLSDCGLDDEAATALGEALVVNTTLSRLNVANNPLTDVGGRALLAARRAAKLRCRIMGHRWLLSWKHNNHILQGNDIRGSTKLLAESFPEATTANSRSL